MTDNDTGSAAVCGAAMFERIWSQVEGGIDPALCPPREKRQGDLAKKLDRSLEGLSWCMYASGLAYAIQLLG